MEYSGLLPKYKVNRPLIKEERELQLKQRQRIDVPLNHDAAIVRMNSTFLESVDKYYGWKGTLTVVTLAVAGLCAWAVVSTALISLRDWMQPTELSLDPQSNLLFLLFTFGSCGALGLLAIWILGKESFAYTHYPIRLNRKNGMVYVFRFDGSVLTVPWNEVFFTFGRGVRTAGHQNWDIRGHVLDKDGSTVRETFSFGTEDDSHENLRCHWEFLRRYMEVGPQAVVDRLDVCVPIAGNKEPLKFGLFRLLLNFHGHFFFQILCLPMFLITLVGRVIAIRTSKPPIWPQEVEDACPVDPDDPFIRDARMNPDDLLAWDFGGKTAPQKGNGEVVATPEEDKRIDGKRNGQRG